MRLRETDDHLDPETERELGVIDRALTGEVPTDPADVELARFATELRDERPEPAMSLEEELERMRANGWKRPGSGESRWRRPGAWLAPMGAVATLAAVLFAVVVTVPGNGPDDSADVMSLSDGGGESTSPVGAEEAASAPPAREFGTRDNGWRQSADDAAAPEAFVAPSVVGGGSAERNARGTEKRQQDRSASLTLKTDTDRVREVSDQVIQITESTGGVVVSQSLNEQTDRATADLQLQLPTRNLDGTLDQLTDLATVESLNEAAVDITKPFVSAQDNLADARDKREQLLEALGNAETEAEADAIQQQIDDARREISRAEARFENIARQARLSDVAVFVNGVPGGDDDGEWGIGDAIDDAGEVLRTAAGIVLVAGAVLVPFAIILGIAWLVLSADRRRRREAALDD